MTYFNDFSANPTKTNFDITFEYLEPSHVHVYTGYNVETEEYETEISSGFTVNGAQVTFDTAPNTALRIIRETPVDPAQAIYYASVAIRAEDLNNNQDQVLFALEEQRGSINSNDSQLDDIRDDIDDLNDLINNSIQFVNVKDVAALNAEAATDPDNLKGYQVLDSTGIDAASPEVLNLPPTAGGGAGEDPVNGVYWNAGIITRVQWNKSAQKWNFVFYYSGDGDNRYQQQTLAAAVTPDPDNYKDGTLWFDSGDGNLYVLYNDGKSRQWVITNPLSAYGQIVTSDDVYWNRDAAENRVYPKNTTDSVGNDATGSAWSIAADGSATFKGTVLVGNWTANSNTPGGTDYGNYIEAIGGYFTNRSDAASTVLRGYHQGTQGVNITAGGSATFKGNVGIGTSSPDEMLHLSNSSGPVLRFENTNTIITSGNSFGAIEFESKDASNASGVVAKIEGFAPTTMDGTAVNGGAIRFSTATVNPTSLAERLRIDSTGNVFISGTLPDSPNISLNADGSASFTKGVISGGNPASGEAMGSRLNDGGTIQAGRPSGMIWNGFTVGNSVPTSVINADGSARFAGELRVENDNNNYGLVVNKTGGPGKGVYITSASISENNDLITCQSGFGGAGVVDKFTVKADGSARFSGQVTLARDAFLGFNNGNPQAAIELNPGPASIPDFPREAECRWNLNYKDIDYLTCYLPLNFHNNGIIHRMRTTGWEGVQGTGDFAIGFQAPNGTNLVGAIGTRSNHGLHFGTNATTALEIDESQNAKFKGNVSADGTIDTTGITTTNLTLNGENLRDKLANRDHLINKLQERIEKADNALQALKTAVATATDFTTLKAAIISSLQEV